MDFFCQHLVMSLMPSLIILSSHQRKSEGNYSELTYPSQEDLMRFMDAYSKELLLS